MRGALRGREVVDEGAVLFHQPVIVDSVKQSVVYIDKVFMGSKPVEQPTKLELVVNLKIAKALGIKTPRSMFVRADEVIQ
jgi:putative ABC transport system substrate-binding protein